LKRGRGTSPDEIFVDEVFDAQQLAFLRELDTRVRR
jgi:hypothetical protein